MFILIDCDKNIVPVTEEAVRDLIEMQGKSNRYIQMQYVKRGSTLKELDKDIRKYYEYVKKHKEHN